MSSHEASRLGTALKSGSWPKIQESLFQSIFKEEPLSEKEAGRVVLSVVQLGPSESCCRLLERVIAISKENRAEASQPLKLLRQLLELASKKQQKADIRV